MADYEKHSKKKDKEKDDITINIIIQNNFTIGNKEFHIEQRAEGGGQINKDVGTNANQGGQNAINGSTSSNNSSQFADGNGRSGIAGNNNDEAGGQQGIKIRESLLFDTEIISTSEHSESGVVSPDAEFIEEPNVAESE